MQIIGIVFAVLALVSWTFGDFFIQRSARQVGNIAALLSIGLLGFIVLTPFIWNEIPGIFQTRFLWQTLGLTLGITFVAAILNFEGLRVGKLAVIEPVMSFELPVTVLIGLTFLREHITAMQGVLIVSVFAGIVLTVMRHEPRHWWNRWSKQHVLERGVILAGFGAIVMALTNIYTAVSSQHTSPLLTIWFIHTGLAITCIVILLARRQIGATIKNIRSEWRPVLGESIFDNAAWISFSTAVLYLPISITVAISESYIVFASLLGILLNREKLQVHQGVGMTIALLSTILLAIISA